MPVDRCRVCRGKFFDLPLLRYANMPAAAQYLPGPESVDADKGADLEVYQCSSCGLVQIGSDPVHYYKDVIRAAAFSEEMKEFRRGQFVRFMRDFCLKDQKIIEVGCGRGEYLLLMSECGMDAYGLEHRDESVRHCNDAGLKVSKGFIENNSYTIPNAPFTAFFILNFLEHLPDPGLVLQGIWNNLVPGAVGLVEVPNFEMILNKRLFSEFISDHLFYFTRETLSSTLGINGFQVMDCREEWRDYILSAQVRRRGILDLSDFENIRSCLRNELREYIGSFTPGRVAVWGAGHQALSVIALTELTGKIKYVVDSATFKQGKYTPATHIPIVPPAQLERDPVDAVIVMAAGYSDEVARLVRSICGSRVSICILREVGLEIVQQHCDSREPCG